MLLLSWFRADFLAYSCAGERTRALSQAATATSAELDTVSREGKNVQQLSRRALDGAVLTLHRHAREVHLHVLEQGRYRVRFLDDDVLHGVLDVRDRARYLPAVEVQSEEDLQGAVLELVYRRALVRRPEYASPK